MLQLGHDLVVESRVEHVEKALKVGVDALCHLVVGVFVFVVVVVDIVLIVGNGYL